MRSITFLGLVYLTHIFMWGLVRGGFALMIGMVDATDPFWIDWLPRFVIAGLLTTYLIPFAIIVVLGKRFLAPVCDDLCKRCHYDLRGIDADKCPECGTAINKSAESTPTV